MPQLTEEEAKNQLDNFFNDEPDQQNKQPVEKDDKKPEEPEKKIDSQEDDEPVFERQSKKKQDSKEENIANLRKDRDALKSKVESYEQSIGDLDVSMIKPVIEFLKEKSDGVITADSVTDVLSEIQTLQEENESLKTKLQEKEKFVEELDVQHSEEFKTKYSKPLADAQQGLLIDIANVGPDKKVIGEKSTREFLQYLTSGGEIDGIELKLKLKEFKDSYKAETGEDHPDVPSVNNLMNSVRQFNKALKDRNDAYQSWGTNKAESKRKQQEEELQNLERSKKENKKHRSGMASKAFREFPLDEDFDFIKEEEAKKVFDEEFRFGEKLFNGNPEDMPPYNELITRGAKSRLFDMIAPLYKQALDKIQHLEKADRSGVRKTTQPKINQKEKESDDWMGSLSI